MSDLVFPFALRELPSLHGVKPSKYGLGAWSDHIPFAFDLVAALQPERLVELGTFSGESYFAFCQAVLESRARTVCYAVDTWEGDEHAGALDESAFRDVTAHNRQLYASFSYLIRGTFDEANTQFSDGSIDLLHIDGLHTYEAVRHDFDHWLPKVSEGGIVLLHDVSARHADFGVWKLWEEISASNYSFLFHHGWGLGVWRKPQTGEAPARSVPFLDMLFSGDPERNEAILSYYALAARELRTRMTYTPPPAAMSIEPVEEPAVESPSAESAATESSAPVLEEDGGRPVVSAEKEIFLQVFFPLEGGGYDESRSVRVALPTDSGWHKVTVDLPEVFTGGRLRVDPLDCCGLFDLAGIQVASRVLVDEPVWTCRNRAQLDALQVHGTADVLPGARYLRIVSYGKDPRLILPEISLDAVGEPLQLEIWMRFHVDWSSLGTSLRLWGEAFNNLPMEKARLKRLETKHQRLETEHQRLEAEHGATRERAEAAEIEMQRLLQTNAEAAVRWEEARAALGRLEAEHGTMRSRAEASEGEVQRLQNENAEAAVRWEEARAALGRLEAEHGTMRSRAEASEGEVQRLQNENAEAAVRWEEARAALGRLEAEHGTMRSRAEASEGEVQRLQNENAEAAVRWEEARAALGRLEAEHGTMREHAEAEVQRLEAEHVAARERAEAVEAEMQRLEQATAEATARWEEARAELDRLEITERDRRNLRKERLLLATELNCLRSEFDVARDKAESDLGALRHQLARKQQEIQRAQEHLLELEGQYHTELGRRRSMQRSVYWKSTMPLRALGRLVSTGSLNKRPDSQHSANGNGKDAP